MTGAVTYPRLVQVVLDSTDARALAEFYRELLGLTYRPGDEPPPAGQPDPAGEDWLVLLNESGRELAVQQVDELPEATWPSGPHPQQLHLDMSVPTEADLSLHHERAYRVVPCADHRGSFGLGQSGDRRRGRSSGSRFSRCPCVM